MKTTRLLLCAAALLTLSLPAYALNDKDAEKAAYLHVPADAVLEKVEWDDGLYEVDFFVKETQERYEVRVDPQSGEVISLESEMRAVRQTGSGKLDEKAVREAVDAAYPGATILQMEERRDDGNDYYAVLFSGEKTYGTLEMDAYTGDVLEREIYFGETFADGMLSAIQAQERVLAYKPDAQIDDVHLEEDDGRYCWEGTARLDGRRYEFSVNAITGDLMEWERD